MRYLETMKLYSEARAWDRETTTKLIQDWVKGDDWSPRSFVTFLNNFIDEERKSAGMELGNDYPLDPNEMSAVDPFTVEDREMMREKSKYIY